MFRPSLSKWFARRCQVPKKIRKAVCLRLERLEDRVVPSTFLVNELGDTHAINPSGQDQSGHVSLRSAIEAANALGGNQTIQFDPTVFASFQNIFLTLGVLDLHDSSGVLSIAGPTAGLAISGNHVSEVFRVELGTTAQLTGLTIRDGVITGRGGGIYNAGTLTINHSIITGNTAILNPALGTNGDDYVSGQGGGIFNYGVLTVADSTIESNFASYGGGIANFATATLIHDTLRNNSAAIQGGGIYNDDLPANLLVSDSIISGNTSQDGAGILNEGLVTLRDSTISGNVAQNVGGGLDNYETGIAHIYNCTFANNGAASGGAIGNTYYYSDESGALVTLVNSTFSGNHAQDGGAISIYGEASVIANDCTISGNSAAVAGGIDVDSGSLVLNNSIVAANTGDVLGHVEPYSLNNLIGNGTGIIGISNGVNGNQIGSAASPINPQLAPLGNYGGPTQTMIPLPGSPAIGAGALVALPFGLTTDQSGLPRTVNGRLDIGAVESNVDFNRSGSVTTPNPSNQVINVTVSAQLTGLPTTTGDYAGLIARYTGDGTVTNATYYLATLVGDGNGGYLAAIYKHTGGSFTLLTSQQISGGGLGAGNLEFDVQNTSLRLFLNGNLVASTTDSSISAAGTPGYLTQNLIGAAFSGFQTTTITLPTLPFQLLDDGQLQQNVWTTIDSHVAVIQIDGTGVLYDLEESGALWQFSGGSWLQIDSNVASIKVVNNVLWDLETSGALWERVNGVWSKPDTGVAAFDVSASGVLYDLEANGALWTLTGTTWAKTDSGVLSFHLGVTGVVAYQKQDGSIHVPGYAAIPGTGLGGYGVDSNGDVWVLSNGTLSQYGSSGLLSSLSGVGSFALTPNGQTLVYRQGASLNEMPVGGGSPTVLNANVSSFVMAYDGTIDALAGGKLVQFAPGAIVGTNLDPNPVNSFGVARNGTVFALESTGALVALNVAGRMLEDSDVASMALATNDTLYEVENGGVLWMLSASGSWSQLDSNVAAIRLGTNNALYDLEASGALWRYSNSSWSQLDTGVSMFAVSPTNVLEELESNGALWQLAGNTWTKLDTSVASLQMNAGGVLAYQKQDGSVHVLTFASAIPGTGLGSYGVDVDGNVWVLNGSSLEEFNGGASPVTTISSVASFALTPSDQVVYLTQAGVLDSVPVVGGSATQLASGVSSFAIDSVGTVYALASGSGTLSRFAPGATSGVAIDANAVRSFVVAANGNVFAIETTANTLVSLTDGRRSLETFVASIAVSSNVALYVLKEDESLGALTAHHTWTSLDTGVASFVVSPSGILYELKTNGRLWQLIAGTWTLRDTGVSSIGMASDGTLVELESSGNLWKFNAAGWLLLGSNVSSFSFAVTGTYQIIAIESGNPVTIGV